MLNIIVQSVCYFIFYMCDVTWLMDENDIFHWIPARALN